MIHIISTPKKILAYILLILIGFPFTGGADVDVTLEWKSDDLSIEGYQVFYREEGESYDYDSFFWQGDHTFDQYTIDGLDEDKIYFFVVRSFSGEDMSQDSNEVRYPPGESNDGGSGCYINSTSCFD